MEMVVVEVVMVINEPSAKYGALIISCMIIPISIHCGPQIVKIVARIPRLPAPDHRCRGCWLGCVSKSSPGLWGARG